jgi:hypothetical protein
VLEEDIFETDEYKEPVNNYIALAIQLRSEDSWQKRSVLIDQINELKTMNRQKTTSSMIIAVHREIHKTD